MSPEPDREAAPPVPDAGSGSPWGRALRIVLVVLGLAIGGIALASVWLGEEQQDLPFDYERFE